MDSYWDTIMKEIKQNKLEYAKQSAYCEAKPIIDEMGLGYFINMITERYKNEQQQQRTK